MEGYTTQSTTRPYTTIGVIGQPNVGKSTLINTLFGRKVVSTSKTPGRTKHFQTIFISKTVRLCDCPGLIFPSYAKKELQILSGLYPISQVREPYTSVSYLASKIPLVSILDLDLTPDDEEWSSTKASKKAVTTNIHDEKESDKQEKRRMGKKAPESVTAFDLCDAYARKRGFFTAKAGRPDSYRAANQLLRMTVEGRLIMAFKPPKFYHRAPHTSEAIKDTDTTEHIKLTDQPDGSDSFPAAETTKQLDSRGTAQENAISEVHSEQVDESSEESESDEDIAPARTTNAFSLLMDD